jgi:RimJ/RimL family protein N-acetyltransferase
VLSFGLQPFRLEGPDDSFHLTPRTRHHHIEGEHRRLEIGVTWIGTAFQRTHINTEAKLLQLWYAFDVLKCRRVELKADVDNRNRAPRSRGLEQCKRASSAST